MRREDGQVLMLVLVYAVIAGVLVTVVVNLSRAYLDRRALVAAVDAAALAAANEPDLARIYNQDEVGAALPLSPEGARTAVRRYVRDAALRERFAGFRIVEVNTRGPTVAVTFAARVDLPFGNLLSTDLRSGYWFDATARATTPLLR